MQVCAIQVYAPQVCAFQVREGQICAPQINTTQVYAPQINITQVCKLALNWSNLVARFLSHNSRGRGSNTDRADREQQTKRQDYHDLRLGHSATITLRIDADRVCRMCQND